VEGQVDGSVVNVAIVTFMERKSLQGGKIRLWGCGGNALTVRYRGILGISIQFRTESIQVPYVSVQIRMRRV
jgi:hypothetical protein